MLTLPLPIHPPQNSSADLAAIAHGFDMAADEDAQVGLAADI